MTYPAGEEFCKSIGGQYPKLESKEDVDELSKIVLKYKKKWIGFWIPLKEDNQGKLTWTDGSPFDTSLAERVIESENDCKGPKCHFLFSAKRNIILGDKHFPKGTTNVMCVISDLTDSPGCLEKSKKELESLEAEINAVDSQVAEHGLTIKQHVSQLSHIKNATKESLEGIQETLKKLKNQLISN